MKMPKLLIISAIFVLAGLSSNALSQPVTEAGIGISIWAEYKDTNDVAYFAVVGTELDYFVRVSLTSIQYPIYHGEPNLYLPNGTVIDLDDNLALATGASTVYGPYAYTVSLANLGQLTGADADEVRAKADVIADANRPSPASDQEVSAATNWDIVVMEPNITVTKVGEPDTFCEGTEPNVTYTYYVENTGNEDLTSVVVSDDTCSPVGFADPNGDNGDGLLNPGETWVYECTMVLTATTENIVDVDAVGYWTGTPVSDSNSFEVVAVPPPVVDVDPNATEICQGDSVQLCAVVTDAIGDIVYSWTKDGEPFAGDVNCIDVNEAGEYCVHIVDQTTGCEADACATVTVVPTPDCLIDGPATVCEDSNNVYCTNAVADTYLWEITGDGVIVGPNDVNCVTVSVGASGFFTLSLTVTKIGDTIDCSDTCELRVTVEECGQTFCSFTQGFYGNAGGKACDGTPTPELISALLKLGGPVVVGVPGNSITLSSATCIIERLPAGGTPMALDLSADVNDNCGGSANKLLNDILMKGNKDGRRYNNVLIGQVVALTLNVRLGALPCLDPNEPDGLLGNFVLPDEPFCTAPYDNPEAPCPKHVEIPVALQGMTVAELLDAANAALGGDDTYSMSDIYKAVTAINEGFDECRTIVPCPVEICGNLIDDDCDGEIDEGCLI